MRRREFFQRVGVGLGVTALVPSAVAALPTPASERAGVGRVGAWLWLVTDGGDIAAPPLRVHLRASRMADGDTMLTYPAVTWKRVEADVPIVGMRIVVEVPGIGPFTVLQRFPAPVRPAGGDVTVTTRRFGCRDGWCWRIAMTDEGDRPWREGRDA